MSLFNCESSYYPEPTSPEVCTDWPPALRRARGQGNTFVAEFRSGTLVAFQHAVDLGEGWVHLKGAHEFLSVPFQDSNFLNPDSFKQHGIQARVSDIVWVGELARR